MNNSGDMFWIVHLPLSVTWRVPIRHCTLVSRLACNPSSPVMTTYSLCVYKQQQIESSTSSRKNNNNNNKQQQQKQQQQTVHFNGHIEEVYEVFYLSAPQDLSKTFFPIPWLKYSLFLTDEW